MNDEAIIANNFFQRINGLYPVSEAVVADACTHALDVFPQESCGIVSGGLYHRVPNTSANPNSEFEISVSDQLSVCQPNEIEAIIHSHPSGVEGPTISDMKSQFGMDVPYGIVVIQAGHVSDVLFYGGNTPIAPMAQRPFKAGVYDCYSLVRDKFRRDRGILLRDYDRDPEWWLGEQSPNMLVDFFEAEGFYQINEEELRDGDCFLAKPFRTPMICHCGYINGDGSVLHHFGSPRSQRLSVVESIYNVKSSITHWLRHKDSVQPSAKEE